MRVAIGSIKVAARIRKDVAKIGELAVDIKKHGLLNPVTVMEVDGGEFRLLAGLRRLKAVESLGSSDIDVNVVAPADAETALRIEFSENEQREPFTFSEKMDFARLIEEIETAKARERMIAGKKADDPVDCEPQGTGKSRDLIGEKIGMSGRQYARARFVAENATSEVLDELDKGERSIRGAYDELRAKSKPETAQPTAFAPKTKSTAAPPPAPKKQIPAPPTQDDFAAMKVKNDALLTKCAVADHKRDMLETQLHNTNLQWQCEREGKDGYIAELSAKLEAARARIAELEAALALANARIAELEGKPDATAD